MRCARTIDWISQGFGSNNGHLVEPIDRRLVRLIGRSMRVPGRHGFQTFFKEFMHRGYEAEKRLPKPRR